MWGAPGAEGGCEGARASGARVSVQERPRSWDRVCALHRAVLSVHAVRVTGCECTYVYAQASWKTVRARVLLTDCVCCC